jgi:NitT/TauT family transport system substrate-binding protein
MVTLFKPLSTSCPVHGIFVRANSPIQTVADLVNTKIAVNTNRAIDEVMVPPLVVKYGADPSGIQFVPIAFPEMFAALKQGDVDAVVQIEPFVTIGNADLDLRRIAYNYIELQPVTEISSLVAIDLLRKYLFDPLIATISRIIY